MNHTLPKLPYAYDALEPYFDARTMEIHHMKHHQTYVDKLNGALTGHEAFQDKSPEALLKNLDEVPESIRTAVRNHAGGHANHSFWWPMLKKDISFGGPVADAVKQRFGSYEKFKETFSNFRQWVDLAGAGPGQSGDRGNAQPGQSYQPGQNTSHWHRRLGACLLPEVPEPSAGLHRRLLQCHQLGSGERHLHRGKVGLNSDILSR